MLRRPLLPALALTGSLLLVHGCGGSDSTGPSDPGGNGGGNTDTSPPTVTISSPSDGATVAPFSTVTVEGTASDDVGVTEVRVSVGGQPPVVAQGTTSWSVELTVAGPGAVSVSAVAEDGAGNVSATARLDLTVPEGWGQLGATLSGATDVALGSDGNRLLRFPCVAVANRDEGEPAEFDGSSWTVFASLTNQCHEPSMDVEGDLWVAGFIDDSDNSHFASNINGATVVLGPPTNLRDQWGVDVAFAQGTGYTSYVTRFSDGSPVGTLMLHIRMPLGPADANELRGGWGRLVGVGHDLETAITGDETGWYVVFEQAGNLYVNRGAVVGGANVDEEIGGAFSLAGQPQGPDIVLYQGGPVVSFLDAGRSTMVVARWDGTQWVSLGQLQVDTGFVGRTRMAVDGDDLYVLTVLSDAEPALVVDHFDGSEWSRLPDPLDPGDTPSATRGDVVVYQGSPVIAYLSGGLKVKRFFQD